MNIGPQIKQSIKSLFKHGWIIIAGFVLLPLVMSIINGIMMENTFEGKGNIESTKVQIKYSKDSDHGKILKEVLNKDGVKSFIEENESDPECRVTINDDFTKVNIENITASDSKIDIVKNFFQNFLSDVSIIHKVNNKINDSSLSENEKNKVMMEVLSMNQDIQQKSSLKENIQEGYKTLNSREYYSISVFSFTSILLVMALTFIYYNNSEDGVIRRTFASPVKKTQYILGFAISSSITAFIVNFIYIIICRLLRISFKGSIGLIVLTALLQSIMQGSIAAFLVAFIKEKKICMSIIGAVSVISAVAGGAFYNIDAMKDSALSVLGNLSFGTLILKAYKSIEISGIFKEAAYYGAIMLAVAAVCVLISEIKVKVRWEE